MITFFYEMVRRLKKEGRAYWPLVYKINKLLLNLFYPILYGGKKREKGTDESSPIIISLTTYPARVGTVWITITSLLNQTKQPQRVILWLAEEQFQDKKIPKRLMQLQKRGLEIRYCEDLKPHKKYFYTMQEYPECFVVTADDDIFYPENHIENLWKGHEKYPDAIICHWSHKIGIKENKDFEPYNEWTDNGEDRPSVLNLAVGCNGILYPPGCLPPETFNKEKINQYALRTDDLWLKCMSVRNNTNVVNCNETILIYFNILKAQKSGLWKTNTGQEQNNDRVWRTLMEAYPEVKKRLLNAVG